MLSADEKIEKVADKYLSELGLCQISDVKNMVSEEELVKIGGYTVNAMGYFAWLGLEKAIESGEETPFDDMIALLGGPEEFFKMFETFANIGHDVAFLDFEEE